ncbi:MAG TPA: DUF3302 domain-containing protein [Caldimonas sp.]|nr:DUF3302 domain-containing protein [Caldimonas sp.]
MRVVVVRLKIAAAFVLSLLAAPVHASLFKGEQLDAVANGIAWVALVIVPIAGIVVFWLVHILPEKIAEKKKHPQTAAIQTTCLLSLLFGGMLWPIAWVWATTKPVLHKAAYGTDVWDREPHAPAEEAPTPAMQPQVSDVRADLQRLREQIERLSARTPTAQELDAMRAELDSVQRAVGAAQVIRQGG